jgi:quercetin dioxygenase-like cupin family protein
MPDQPGPTTLPDRCVPYVLHPGEGPAYLVAGQSVRLLAGVAETGGAFGAVLCASPRDPGPIPMHWHAREHDTWLCIRGRLQVWCKDQSRILHPGDFAYVLPGDTHSYRCIGQSTEFFGVVAPGGWEKFFTEAGIPWDHPTFPPTGSIPPDFARMGPAMGKFGVNRIDNPVYVAPRPIDDDTALPAAPASFFLQAGFGPRYVLNHLLATTLLGPEQTGGLFAMQIIEAPHGAAPPPAPAHETLHVLAGTLAIALQGQTHLLSAGATANLPAGTARVTVASQTARWVSTTAGDQALRHYERKGTPTDAVTFPL